jgi:RHS repeat-associated protein
MAGYSTASDNRLTFDGTYTYTYNAEGAISQKVGTTATWTYGWDNMNRLVGVKEVTTTGTQLSVSYSYDVLNNRVEDDTWKSSTGTTLTVRHAYDGTNSWADVTTSNTLLARYVYGDGVDQVWARAVPAGLTNAGVAWYLTDRQGSVRDIMNASSVIGDHADYDGFGNATHTTISFADRFGYAGGLYSYDTKMEQFGKRWYDPATGRWVSEDPSGFGGGPNLYGYTGNDPTNAIDPSGEFWWLLPVILGVAGCEGEKVLTRYIPTPQEEVDSAVQQLQKFADTNKELKQLFKQAKDAAGGDFQYLADPTIDRHGVWDPNPPKAIRINVPSLDFDSDKILGTILWELFNAKNSGADIAIQKKAKAGELSRIDFVVRSEELEFDSISSFNKIAQAGVDAGAWGPDAVIYRSFEGVTFAAYLAIQMQFLPPGPPHAARLGMYWSKEGSKMGTTWLAKHKGGNVDEITDQQVKDLNLPQNTVAALQALLRPIPATIK